MNKDQKLLEEAYQSIYENALEPLYFGPPESKRKWLRWLFNLDHEVHLDGFISINGGVSLTEKKLKRIPFNFRRVEGDFLCYNNHELDSLKGCPEFVKGSFVCSSNNLTSLEGSPSVVGDSFNCSHNKLISLQGAPSSIEGSFICAFNKLTSLQGAPEKVGETFNCVANFNLTALVGAPKFIGGQFLSNQFSDEQYRDFIKHEKYVKGKLDKDFDIDLQDF
jgi:hypothetical protein